jgi:hypothetical protein
MQNDRRRLVENLSSQPILRKLTEATFSEEKVASGVGCAMDCPFKMLCSRLFWCRAGRAGRRVPLRWPGNPDAASPAPAGPSMRCGSSRTAISGGASPIGP